MYRCIALAPMLAIAACSGDTERPRAAAPPSGDAATASDPAEPASSGSVAVAPFPPYPPHVRSVRLRRSVAVRLAPGPDAQRLGTIAQDTRVEYRAAAVRPGCDRRWIEIEPRGWICEAYLEPTTRPIDGVELPKLARGERVPGTYGKVPATARLLTAVNGAVTAERAFGTAAQVRRYAEATLRGVHHWRVGPDQYVAASAVQIEQPSGWGGTRLGDDTGLTLPIGFAVAGKGALAAVQLFAEPEARTAARKIERRTVVRLLETARGADGAPLAYRVGEAEWLRAVDVRIAELTPPPPFTRPAERWIDLDLDRQVLVAYEGERPVYVTLVSSGTAKNPTATGMYRVWVKFAETDMSGQMAGEEAYSVATVPWTQYYAKDLALHTAYWHDKFGLQRSHGCVNLSPVDARFLYFWSWPDVPPGWSMAHGLVERPGSLVRVRSAADPQPQFQGYAVRVHQARAARAGIRAEAPAASGAGAVE